MSGEKCDVSGAAPATAQEGAPFVVIDDDAPEQGQQKPAEPTGTLGVVIETDDETPITPTREPVLPPPPPALPERSVGAGTYAVVSLVALVVVYWAVSFSNWVYDQFARHGVLGYAILPFVVAAAVLSARWIWGEISAWRRLVITDRLRAELSATHQSPADTDRFLSALGNLEAAIEESQGRSVAAFLKNVNVNRGADELRIIFDHDVLHPMDEAALATIHRAVRDIFFLSLVTPTLIGDTVGFALRAIGMIRGVAMAYGHRPGKLGLYGLVRRMLADVTILAGVEIVMHRVSSMATGLLREAKPVVSGVAAGVAGTVAGLVVGPGAGKLARQFAGKAAEMGGEMTADLMDAFGEEIAEAATAAARMAKLGLLAITVSRPLTLTPDKRQEISSRLRAMIFGLRGRSADYRYNGLSA